MTKNRTVLETSPRASDNANYPEDTVSAALGPRSIPSKLWYNIIFFLDMNLCCTCNLTTMSTFCFRRIHIFLSGGWLQDCRELHLFERDGNAATSGVGHHQPHHLPLVQYHLYSRHRRLNRGQPGDDGGRERHSPV